MASFNFTNIAKHIAKGEVNWNTGTFKVLLVSSIPTTTETTGNQDVWNARSDVTNEITGTNYTAGGIAQAYTLNALTLAGNKQTITWTNITNGWTSATFSAVGAIIYWNSGTSSTDYLVAFVDFGGTVSCTNGNFSITYSTTTDISV